MITQRRKLGKMIEWAQFVEEHDVDDNYRLTAIDAEGYANNLCHKVFDICFEEFTVPDLEPNEGLGVGEIEMLD